MAILGSCLCGAVRFAIDGRVSSIGCCHCSKCLKVTGAGAIPELMVATAGLRFTQGEQSVKRYAQPSGYSTAFCVHCGSPLPKAHHDGRLWWVPAGVLDDDPGVGVEMHIYVASMAPWDEIPEGSVQHAEEPPEEPGAP